MDIRMAKMTGIEANDKYIVEVLRLGAKGLNNRDIANALYLSEGTVRNYISAILDKLDLKDRTQLAIFYLRSVE